MHITLCVRIMLDIKLFIYSATMDKFVAYYNSPEKIEELSQYVHENFKLISTKMISEMRRKLDINPSMDNSDGYVSLMLSLQGRLFNEMVYSIAGACQSTGCKFVEMIPPITIEILFTLIKGENPLNGKMRTDITEDLTGFKVYYQSQIEYLRSVIAALPK